MLNLATLSRSRLAAGIVGFVAFSVVGASAALAHPTIDVAAANWKFTPAKIVLHLGETTTLHLTSTAGVHGIKSTELGIPDTMLTPGKFVDVTVTPKKTGTYKVYCSVFCGAGHADMYLTVEVKDHAEGQGQ